ncbi:MAG: DUF4173 domain-containing protein [Pyrinomonadaceae bacterium]|nr:DUF4173 domain-containing protein [Pyrinomonadaceae bacterium]
MKSITKTGVEMLQVAALLGIAGNLLIRVDTPGLNLFLCALIFVAGLVALLKRNKPEFLNSESIMLLAAILFFGSMFALYDSPELLFLDTVSILVLLGVLVVPALSYRLTETGVTQFFAGGVTAGMSAVFGPILLLGDDIKWNKTPKSNVVSHSISVVRGLALAVPVVFVVGALLMSADESFRTFVSGTFKVDLNMFVSHVAISSLLAWGVLGYFRAVIFGARPKADSKPPVRKSEPKPPSFSITEHTTEDPAKDDEPKVYSANDGSKARLESMVPEIFRLGKIETGILLGAVNVLFVTFILFQLPYLFGGFDLVQQTPDYKLAEYARHGVAELILVSMLILPLLLVTHFLLKKNEHGLESLFRGLAWAQIGLLFVIMISAVNRLNLLTGILGYGQTIDRFYSYFLLIWMALIFVWFGMTVLRGLRKQFAYGALWSFLFVLAVLHWVNPDDYIVRTNVELMQQGREFDAYYNSRLSADSIPALIGSLDYMSIEDRQTVLSSAGNGIDCGAVGAQDFRSWNLSRVYAQRYLMSQNIDYTRNCWLGYK